MADDQVWSQTDDDQVSKVIDRCLPSIFPDVTANPTADHTISHRFIHKIHPEVMTCPTKKEAPSSATCSYPRSAASSRITRLSARDTQSVISGAYQPRSAAVSTNRWG